MGFSPDAGIVRRAGDVLHHDGGLDRLAGVLADGEDAVVGHEHRPRAMSLQRVDDAASDLLVADQRQRTHRDLATELIGLCREHAGNGLATRRPRRGEVRMGVHHPVDVGHVAVDVGV